MSENLQKLRRRIDRIDRRLVKLLARRYKEVCLIGRLKREANRDVVDPEREEDVLKRVLRLVKEEEQSEYIRSIYLSIFKESSNIQREGV
ncbi:MAG: chorismate mutase [Spirochaetota bacterium]|nr:MAG: chorismate mutase [Spirochaetota bacterium]